MSDRIAPGVERLADTEKITVNLGPVDLGRIDLLVRDGFYGNRADFIRTAIRAQLRADAEAVSGALQHHSFTLGLRDLTRADLEAARDRGETLHLRVVGLLRIAPDVPADLARAAIGSVNVLGALHASPAVKAALADRQS